MFVQVHSEKFGKLKACFVSDLPVYDVVPAKFHEGSLCFASCNENI